jgi:hypothetical protein
MTAPAPIARLSRLEASLRAGKPLPASDALPIADALQTYLCDGGDLEAALGVKPAPGSRSAATRAKLDQRDAALRECADEFFPGMATALQAEHIATALLRYAAAGWPRDKGDVRCPPRHRGKIQADLWRILQAIPMPISARQVRKILALS